VRLLEFSFALLLASAADARVTYAQYEGRDAIREGQGGSKLTKDGIDFWTTGQPPRKYLVLGVLTDGRREGVITKSAIGSGMLAKRVHDLGGDALVVVGQNSIISGATGITSVFGSGQNASATTTSILDDKTITQFLVVKYVNP